MIRIGRVVRVAGAVAVVAAVAGACGDGAADDAAPAGPNETSLRVAAEQWARAITEGDYAAAYRFQSARCRLTLGQDAYVEELSQRYGGRDLADSEPEITVTVSGETGQVTVRHSDERAGEDEDGPAGWKFADGQWRYDTC